MLKTYSRLVLFILLLYGKVVIAQSSTNKLLITKLDEVASSFFKKDFLGGAVLVVQHGKVIYEKALGKANLELNVSLSTENVFRIGSLTKQFTAVAILQLVEKNLLKLDDDIT